MSTNNLLDTGAAKAVVDQLGAGTFSPRALELTAQEGTHLAVPSDGWAQLLFYRKDLFDKAGLPAPDPVYPVVGRVEASVPRDPESPPRRRDGFARGLA
jgi:hypothetical protein